MRRVLASRPATLAFALVALVFAVDLSLPLGVAAAVPYTFAVLLALSARPAWIASTTAGLCMVLTVAKMEIAPERGTTEMWKVLVNRGLALFAIGMTTLLGLARRRAEATIRTHEEQLARMSRLAVAGELATVLAHELNQPLAAVCLQAEVAARMLEEVPTPPALREALSEVVEQSRRAAEIVRSIRRTIRKESAQRELVDLNDAVRAVARLLDWTARRAAVDVHLELAEEALVAHGDRVQLEQVLFNLLQNAIEATESRGDGPRTVNIATARDGDMVAVRVRDSGLGLRELERLFERFYTTKPNGMGLGLAICRSTVESHGGRLRGENVPGGAEFAFTLPALRKESR